MDLNGLIKFQNKHKSLQDETIKITNLNQGMYYWLRQPAGCLQTRMRLERLINVCLQLLELDVANRTNLTLAQTQT